MTREELEQRLWHALRNLGADRNTRAPHAVEQILDACDVYAATADTAIRAALAASDTPVNTMLRRVAALAATGNGKQTP